MESRLVRCEGPCGKVLDITTDTVIYRNGKSKCEACDKPVAPVADPKPKGRLSLLEASREIAAAVSGEQRG